MKIAILYADYGSGHRSASLKLKELLKDHDVELYNARREANKYSTAFTEYVYNDFVTKNASNSFVKNSYHISYKLVGGSKILSHLFVKRMGYKFIEDVIEGEEPDLIITTFPYYITNENVKTLTIITDYTVDNTWYDKKTDYYFVGSEELKEQLVKKHADADGIFVTGIPLDPKFEKVNNSTFVNHVLFNLGARGQVKLGDVQEWIDFCLEKGVEVSVLCGKNQEMYEVLRILYGDRIDAYDFTDRVAEILEESDIVVTKAGGLTVTECIMSEKPMIINKDQSLKGQEKKNYDFLDAAGASVTVKEKDITKELDRFIENPKLYQEAVLNIRNIKVKDQEAVIMDAFKKIEEEIKK